MQIYTVASGDSVYSIARMFGVSPSLIISDNELSEPTKLPIGQSLLIRQPTETYTVSSGDTLSMIAERFGVTPGELWRQNPTLGGGEDIYPGEVLVIRSAPPAYGDLITSAYVYPFIDADTLRRTLPYLSYLTIFTYGIRRNGTLIPPGDDSGESRIIELSRDYGTRPLMMLSTLTEDGTFSNKLADFVLNNPDTRNTVIRNLVDTVVAKGYAGVDLDFEYLGGDNAAAYAQFVRDVKTALSARGDYVVWVALAPKTEADQPGLLYAGHDYEALAAAADRVLLMTYEWGYAFGPPLAIAPLNEVRAVVNYALTEAPSEKIMLGIPNYGYDWTLPYVRGISEAEPLSNIEAPRRAYERRARIMFDEAAQSPYYSYYQGNREHIVWFEDPRSINAKAALIYDTSLSGAGIWNGMKFFPALWLILNDRFNIIKY